MAGLHAGRGEALAACLLQPIVEGADALAVLKSVNVNQDGRSSSLTAPNGPAQARLISEALVLAQSRPAALSYISLHGTGTPLGDPIELGAIMSATRSVSESHPQSLVLGSSKVRRVGRMFRLPLDANSLKETG